jgi:hypothetical protein
MHEGQERADRARKILAACGIEIGTDFGSLSASQIDALVTQLEQHRRNKYGAVSEFRGPPRDNDSGIRSFHDLLQRRAKYQLRRRNSLLGMQ